MESQLSFSLDKERYAIGEEVTVAGKVRQVSDQPLLLQVFDAEGGAFNFDQVPVDKTGRFSYTFNLGGPLAIEGTYEVVLTYRGQTTRDTFQATSLAKIVVRIRKDSSILTHDAYDPSILEIEQGSAVSFRNDDLTLHTATSGDVVSAEPDGEFDTDFLGNQKVRTITFKKSGIFHYFCQLHPNQRGTIIVKPKAGNQSGVSTVVSEHDRELASARISTSTGIDQSLSTLRSENTLRATRNADFLRRHFGPETLDRVKYSQVIRVQNRTLTIVFWDIRGFTRHMNSLHELHELVADFVRRYEGAARKQIDYHNGMFDKIMGDGIMAIFGITSRGGESEDASNAIRCAIALKKDFGKIKGWWGDTLAKNGHSRAVRLGLGCGINTGRVIFGRIGSDASDQLTAIGNAVNFAQRLETHAKSGEILISQSTMAHVKDNFEFKGPLHYQFKGLGKKKYYDVRDEKK